MQKIEGFSQMLQTIENEKGIPKEMLLEAVKASLVSACRKRFAEIDNLEAEIDAEGKYKIFAKKIVAKSVENAEKEISLAEAKKKKAKAKEGDEIKIDITPHDFGRLAAQTAKQVIIQRIREAEKDLAFEEFKGKEGDIITGTVQRKEYGGYLINLGRIETLLPLAESIPGELLRPRDKVKLILLKIDKDTKGPHMLISRSHPDLVKKLFQMEVPEICEGILEIKGIAREAGRRTKIAIQSKDKNVGAVGTCVGHMGNRIQNIVRELGNERVDIIEWNKNPKIYISHALSPAKISKIETDEKEMTAKVIVPEDQLSLAIGKEGQNVRLAVKLTGWKIDINPDEKAAAGKEKTKEE